MLQSVNVRLPLPVFDRLQQVAKQRQRSIVDIVEALVIQAEPFPSLVDEVEREMLALASFPNEILLLLAQNPMAQESQQELASLNEKAQRIGRLKRIEEERQQELLDSYQQAMLRRAYCLEILRRRGYDLSDLLRLPTESAV